jgi:uncharacterized membrane protein
MIYLLGSILLTSYLLLSFKYVERFGISNLQVIVANYWVCVITGSLVGGTTPFQASTVEQSWFPYALIIGAGFISLLFLIATVAQRMGVSVVSVASKLALIIPFLMSIYLYQEQVKVWHIGGILLALPAVVMTSVKPAVDKSAHATALSWRDYVSPFILFVGSGFLDTLVKYVEQTHLAGQDPDHYLVTGFATAGTIGLVVVIFRVVTGKEKFQWKSILAGLLIGIPNYFSIWCLMKALAGFPGKSSSMIPMNNLGIVVFSTVVAIYLFHEKLLKINRWGLLLAILSITLLAIN